MSGDYKWDIQVIFEDECRKRFNCEYWELAQDQQFRLYSEAERIYADRMFDRADYLRKAAKENS